MTDRPIRNIAASVHQRLLNQARKSDRPFGELLQYYAIERFLYRLSKSSHSREFILKGALMLVAWRSPLSRPTRDIDLLGRVENSIASVTTAVKDICLQAVEPDGIVFDPANIQGERITEDADYPGVRIRLPGRLGQARLTIRIDVGFGDAVPSSGRDIIYPTLLDYPAPRLAGYSRESLIAEKFEIMVKRGEINSRMKDFYDIWLLARQFDFRSRMLSKAIEQTFNRRGTELPETMDHLMKVLIEDETKEIQWRSFIRKTRLEVGPRTFTQVIEGIREFLDPVLQDLRLKSAPEKLWKAPGPWASA